MIRFACLNRTWEALFAAKPALPHTGKNAEMHFPPIQFPAEDVRER